VLDETPPVFSREPQNTTLSCSCESFPAIAEIKAHDNCDEVTVESDEETLPGTCDNEYTLVRTWYVEDSAGNFNTMTQIIEIIDEDEPVFCDEEPNYLGVPCDQISVPPNPDAGDDCGDATVFPGDEAEEDVVCPNEYTIVYTWTAVDECGNEADHESRVSVYDDVAPQLETDDPLCLFPRYGSGWGMWAQYNLADLFAHYDNCDESTTSSYIINDYVCNVTDTGVIGLDDCSILTLTSNEERLYVKITANDAGASATVSGRTYHVYATIEDSCGNTRDVRRDIWIAPNEYIYEHRLPCDAGGPQYKSQLPVVGS